MASTNHSSTKSARRRDIEARLKIAEAALAIAEAESVLANAEVVLAAKEEEDEQIFVQQQQPQQQQQQQDESQNPPSNPDEAVAFGTAVQAAISTDDRKDREGSAGDIGLARQEDRVTPSYVAFHRHRAPDW